MNARMPSTISGVPMERRMRSVSWGGSRRLRSRLIAARAIGPVLADRAEHALDLGIELVVGNDLADEAHDRPPRPR